MSRQERLLVDPRVANRLTIVPDGFRPGNRILRAIGENLATFFAHLEVPEESRRNIIQAADLWMSGMEAWTMERHEGHADGPLIRPTLARGSRKMADATFFFMGDRILHEFVEGLFARNYPEILIPQPPDPTKDNGHRDREKDFALLKQAAEAIPKVLQAGRVAMIFPEGTRSRTGELGVGMPQIARYLSDNAFILPMLFDGSRERWPVGKRPRFFDKGKVTAIVGKPVLVKDIRIEIADFAKTEGIVISRQEEQGLIMDMIMRKHIAPLEPNEEDRGVYKDTNLSLREVLVIVKKRIAEEAERRRRRIAALV